MITFTYSMALCNGNYNSFLSLFLGTSENMEYGITNNGKNLLEFLKLFVLSSGRSRNFGKGFPVSLML